MGQNFVNSYSIRIFLWIRVTNYTLKSDPSCGTLRWKTTLGNIKETWYILDYLVIPQLPKLNFNQFDCLHWIFYQNQRAGLAVPKMTTLWISIFKSSAKLKTTAKSQERKKIKTKSSIAKRLCVSSKGIDRTSKNHLNVTS
jgi:hypothetical protein